jgi:hypothetical protein
MALDISQKQLPPLLSAVLDASTGRLVQSLDSYSSFLSAADLAVHDCRKFRVSITATSQRPSLEALKAQKDGVSRHNVSLLLIYNCYAQHFRPIDKNSLESFVTEPKPSNLSFKGMEYICYDFMIVPKLLSRDDLIETWRSMSLDRLSDHRKAIRQLSFEQFLELLAKLALKLFNKEKVIRSIRHQISEYPTAVDAISFLCHYMNLDNEGEIRKKIEAIGNRADDRHPITGNHDHDSLVDDDASSQGRPHVVNLKKTIFSSLSTTSLITGKVRKLPRRPFTCDKSKLPVIPPPVNYVPPKLLKMIADAEDQLQRLYHSTGPAVASTAQYVTQQLTTKSLEENEDEMKFHRSSDELIPQVEYEPSLVRCFDRYCIHKPTAEVLDHYESEGPFVDLGAVCAGQHYRIKFIVTNDSQDAVLIDVTTIDLDSDDVCISALPGAIVHGLNRSIHLSFTITPGIRSVVGMVNIHTFTARNGTKNIISCPIHYHVVTEESTAKQQRNRCTSKKLGTLVRNDPMRYKSTVKPPPKSFLYTR